MSNLFGLKTRGEINAELKVRRIEFRKIAMFERETKNLEQELLSYWFCVPTFSLVSMPTEPARIKFIQELKDGVLYEKIDAFGFNFGRGVFEKQRLLKWLGRSTLFKPVENN